MDTLGLLSWHSRVSGGQFSSSSLLVMCQIVYALCRQVSILWKREHLFACNKFKCSCYGLYSYKQPF